MRNTLSPLERAVVEAMYNANRQRGFPPPGRFEVVHRENTGGGRYVDLFVDPDSYSPLGDEAELNCLIEMTGLDFGLQAFLWHENGRISRLELAAIGTKPWNGQERPWRIVSVSS